MPHRVNPTWPSLALVVKPIPERPARPARAEFVMGIDMVHSAHLASSKQLRAGTDRRTHTSGAEDCQHIRPDAAPQALPHQESRLTGTSQGAPADQRAGQRKPGSTESARNSSNVMVPAGCCGARCHPRGSRG